MSRAIKFRAWVKNDNEMVYPRSFEIVKVYDNSNEYVYKFDYNTYIKAEFIMQYTGLKDKNGVEIYEGDKVIAAKDGYKTVIGYIIWDDMGADYNIEDNLNIVLCGFGVEEMEYEVIGNIYENPDLIKL